MAETDELTWSQHWSTWLRWKTTVKSDPVVWDRTFLTMGDEVAELSRHQRVASRFFTDHEIFPVGDLSAMTEEADASVRTAGFMHNGKWNAPVGPAAHAFVDRFELAATVSELTGVEVDEPQGATYIAYLETGGHLDFHLDDFHYGEVNLILCLRHSLGNADGIPSSTVFIEKTGYRRCPLMPGEFVLFDGAFTPHGRTPVAAGEQVLLVSFSFKTRSRALWDVAGAPAPPAVPAARRSLRAGGGHAN